MVKAFIFVAAALLAVTAARADDARRPADRIEQPALEPAQPALPDPLDVPKWMGDAIGHILSGETPETDTKPTRR